MVIIIVVIALFAALLLGASYIFFDDEKPGKGFIILLSIALLGIIYISSSSTITIKEEFITNKFKGFEFSKPVKIIKTTKKAERPFIGLAYSSYYIEVECDGE